MAENVIVKILTALLKHQVKKVVGDETLGVIGQEITALGGDKVDEQIKSWLGEKTNAEELENAAQIAQTCFREKVTDNEVQQWMVSLPLGNLPKVVEALEELPRSPDESKLESALQESIALNWKKLSPEQAKNAVNSFLSCLRSALLPIEKQTLMVIGRSILRTEDKVDLVKYTVTRSEEKLDLMMQLLEKQFITGKSATIESLKAEPADYWNLKHPYPMPPNFTGRVQERKMLADWLNNDNENRLFILRALGGFGKSALSWHWLTHDVDPSEWKKVLWWSFYEGDASFENFIEETLKYLKLDIPQGQRPQVDALVKAMHAPAQKILLIMDGFERALRAYSSMNAAYQGDDPKVEENQLDCVNINAEIFLKSICSLPNIKSKVLMTTRLTPSAVKPRGEFMLGCREVELTSMQPADAVEFFHKQKIKGTHAEIKAACAPYGYHPLSLRLLAGRIVKDFENPADIVVAQKLKIDGDLKQQKHHVIEVSYNNLAPHEQKLLSTISCFRSPVELKTLETIGGDVVEAQYIISLQNDLHDLVERGLLHFDDKNKKFDLHPIVRRYAYERLTANNRTVLHIRLSNYFIRLEIPNKLNNINDIAPVIELYHHLVASENFKDAENLFRSILHDPLCQNLGYYPLIIELLSMLFIDGLKEEISLSSDAKARTYNELAVASLASGKPKTAIHFISTQNNIRKEQHNLVNLAIGLGNKAYIHMTIGEFRTAEKEILSTIELHNKSQEYHHKGGSISFYGRLLAYLGDWSKSEKSFEDAEKLIQNAKVLGMIFANRALQRILLTRSTDYQRGVAKEVVNNALNSLKYADEFAINDHSVNRNYIEAYWLLGSGYRLSKDLWNAEIQLVIALNRCRGSNNVEHEADILLDLARLRYDQKKYDEAKSLADEALLISERCSYVLQGADVNLFLAQYALKQEKDKAKAKAYAEEAKKLATCDGPPYYYKVAYEEAERLLASLKV